MSQRKRYVLEGEWSGYRSSQRRVVHRVVTFRPEKYDKLQCVTYTDGTSLILSVRECKPREKVQEIHGYDSLIADCLQYGVNRVDQLPPCCQRCHRKATALCHVVAPLGTIDRSEWLCDVCQSNLPKHDPPFSVEMVVRHPLAEVPA